MALKRAAPKKQLDQLVAALDERIADDRNIELRTSHRGYLVSCTKTRRSVIITPANQDGCLAYEFGEDDSGWKHNVICVWPWDNVDVGAHCIDKWFAVNEGFLFNVPVNGNIHAHSVSRYDGNQVRGPVKE